MNNSNKKLTFLPHGENLRVLLTHQELSESTLKSVLNDKGIFLDHYDKNKTVPELMSLIIDPVEFESLIEKQTNREEKIKSRTLKLPWNSSEDLLEALPEDFSINNLIAESTAYKPNIRVIGSPQFTRSSEDDNKIELVFEIERDNYTKGWDERTSIHKGSITLEKKESGDLELVLRKTHTAKETNDVGELILKHLKKHFKEKELIKKEDDFERILFNHFSNSNRVQFFFAFTSDFHHGIEFERITDLSVFPDSREVPPEGLKEFLDGIKNLRINGQELQSHILISNSDFHEKIIFSSITLKYKFMTAEAKGSCTVEFVFPDYETEQKIDSEFQFFIQKISINKPYKQFANRTKLHQFINKAIEEQKLTVYDKFKS